VAILSLYISPNEISTEELRGLVEKSYATFRHPDITPLKKLNDKTFILELFHGPTFAFKDVALQLLGNLFEFFLLRRNARKAPGEQQEKLTVVGATSGDTGRYASINHFACIIPIYLFSTVPQSMVYATRRTSPSSSFTPKAAFHPSKKPK
jgi:threonine synthase